MNEETSNLPIAPDLEARIVALVLGEASDFETEQLERLIKSRPELAAFKREMEQASLLLHDVGRNELEPRDAQWQLPSERRQVVLDSIHGNLPTTKIDAAILSGEGIVSEPPKFRRRRWMRVLEAAIVTAILVVLIGLMFPNVQRVRESASRLTKDEISHSPGSWDSVKSEPAPTSEPMAALALNSTESTPGDYKELEPSTSGSFGNSSRPNSAVALSAIQDSLQQLPATSSLEAGANLPTNGAGAYTLPPNSNSPRDVSGIELKESPPMTNFITGSALPYSPTLPDPDYGRSSIDPVQADKFIAGFQKHPEVSAGATAANPQVAEPNEGSVQLGGIPRFAEAPLLDLPVLDSIENQKELKSMIASRALIPPQLYFQNAEVQGNKQPGQGPAENGSFADLGGQVSDSTKADNHFRYRSSTDGPDMPDGMGDSGVGMGGGGIGGGIGGGGMGDELAGVNGKRIGGGGMEGRGLGTNETPRLGQETGGGIPNGGEQNDAEFELAQSAPAKPGSPAEGESLESLIDAKNESSKEGQAGEAEKKLADLGGKAGRSVELVPRMSHTDDIIRLGRGGEYQKQQSSQGFLSPLSEVQSKIESELTLRGQTDQNETLAELDKEVDGLSDYGVHPSNGRSRSLELSGKDSTEANRDQLNTAQNQSQESLRGEALHLAKKFTSKREVPSAGLNETNAATESLSTFSLHVSDVSFKLAAAALARGEWPEAAKIRIEEFVNAFDYGDPLPCPNERVACVVEQSIHPFLQQRNLLRISMRTSAQGRAASTPLRLTLVLDSSGSMERIDRQQALRSALSLLAQQLSPSDQITLISFARQPRLLAENVSGSELVKLVDLIGQIPSEGGTNIEAALKLAFEKAASQQTPGVQNRIVLLTDGAVNLGNANPENLSRMVESMRIAGIAFDAAGISADGLNDEVLEALTRKGDGRYYLLDGDESSGGRFAQQIAGALRPSASNVKVQLEFNPKRVGQYKLLGFEKHILEKEDFRNDAVDAAELAAAEAGVALYQIEAKADGEGDVGAVSVRFRDLTTGQMIEQRWPIPYEANALRPDQAAGSIRLATAAAMLAVRLRGEALGETVDLKSLSDLMAGLPEQQQYDPRVQQLKLMIEQARQLSER